VRWRKKDGNCGIDIPEGAYQIPGEPRRPFAYRERHGGYWKTTLALQLIEELAQIQQAITCQRGSLTSHCSTSSRWLLEKVQEGEILKARKKAQEEGRFGAAGARSPPRNSRRSRAR